MEIWKKVNGFEEYEISSFGRVKSLKYGKEKILKATVDGRGYFQVSLHKNGVGKNSKVHILVAIAFLNHVQDGQTQVDHIKEGDKLNNNVDNLQLLTGRENVSKYHMKKTTSSKCVGVSWNERRQKWKSTIHIDGKNKHLGYFANEFDASVFYKNALLAYNNGQEIKTKDNKFSSKYKGVYWRKDCSKWVAQITINGKRKHLGKFTSDIDAYNALKNI